MAVIGYTPGSGAEVSVEDTGAGGLIQIVKLSELPPDAATETTLASVLTALGTGITVSGTVGISGSVAVTGTFFQATQPVSGTFWQATQPVSGTFFQATQPVSIAGTVAVSAAALPLPTGAATEATLATLGTQTTAAAILAKIIAAPATEAKQDTGNTSLATIAGKDFATQATLAAVLAKIIAAPATEAKQDTGNTSLASITTAVQIMDDWDESDRAKVNLIAGQAGIAGGTGVDGATVPRFSLATNVALPAGNNNIGDVDIASALPAGTNNIGDVDILSIAAGNNNIGDVDIASIAAGDNNIGNVDLASAIPAGTNVIGQVFGGFISCTAAVTRPTGTTTYAVNDFYSDSTSAPVSGGYTLTSAARISGGCGIIWDIVAGYSTQPAILPQIELWIFDQAVTNGNENTAFALSDAKRDMLVAIVPITFNIAAGSTSYTGIASNLGIGFTCVGTANLRYLIKTKSAWQPAANDVLTVRAKIEYKN